MKVVEVRIYDYTELGSKAQEHARDTFKEQGLDQDWSDQIYEEAKVTGEALGIIIDDIRFTGFWSQGDGASFIGYYEYKPEAVDWIRDEYPMDTTLHEIADTLARYPDIESVPIVRIEARYVHENSVQIDTDYEEVRDALRSFMRWIYAQLEQEYEYYNSDEYLDELLSQGDEEYWENGARWYG